MNRIDRTRPDSPLLAGPGPHPVGVRHLTLTDPDRFDPYQGSAGPRTLPLELWYPAATGTQPGTVYRTLLRDGVTPVTLQGRAARDAMAAPGAYPLVVLSHGYPGNRFLMSHLAETLASRGYAVAAADHPQSTYDDQGPHGATLYHRPLDQRFLLDALRDHDGIDATRAAIIGYSMGGYGALVTAGAGLDAAITEHEAAPPHDAIAVHLHPDAAPPPAALKAVIAFGPWGMGHGLWPTEALAQITAPLMVVAGSRDDVSDYAGMRAIAERAEGCDRTLLTLVNAGHNAAAPIPAPAESHPVSPALGWAPFAHYADPVWDSVRMNALAQHFAAAFLDRHLKGDRTMQPLLMRETAFGPDAGFAPETSVGLTLENWPAGAPAAERP